MKLVSIIIPTFRRPTYLQRAIESALKQDYSNIEIIVVDDNGAGTPEQLETYGKIKEYLNNSKFKYIKHEKNRNGSYARNTGIKNSKGEYICFLDDDDEFILNKVSNQVKMLEGLGNDWGACYTGHIRVFPSGAQIRSTANTRGNLLFDILASKIDHCAGSTLMVKREVIERVGFFDENFTRHQDIEFILRISHHYNIDVVNEPQVYIYVHPESNRSKTAEQFEIRKRYYLDTFNSLIKTLPNKQQKEINFVHKIDIAKQFLKEKNYNKVIHYIKESGNPILGIGKIVLSAIRFYTKRIKIGNYNG
ncbi:glycosyltransferase family 2 protein [Peribacillus simplex]